MSQCLHKFFHFCVSHIWLSTPRLGQTTPLLACQSCSGEECTRPPAAHGRWKPPWQGLKLSASTPSIIVTPLLFHFNLPKSRQTQCNKTRPWHLVTVNIGSAVHLYCFCSSAEQKGISKTLCRHHVKVIPERSKTTNPSYPLFSTLPLLPPFHMALKGVLTKIRVLAAFMCITW